MEMPLVIAAARRGKGPGIQQKKAAEMAEQRKRVSQIKPLLEALDFAKMLYRELGWDPFLLPHAAATFLARTATEALDLPEAAAGHPGADAVLSHV